MTAATLVPETVLGAVEASAAPAPTRSSTPHWLDQLFASEVFAAQMKLAGRMAPREDQLRRLLLLLEERKGTAIVETAAQRLNTPEFNLLRAQFELDE